MAVSLTKQSHAYSDPAMWLAPCPRETSAEWGRRHYEDVHCSLSYRSKNWKRPGKYLLIRQGINEPWLFLLETRSFRGSWEKEGHGEFMRTLTVQGRWRARGSRPWRACSGLCSSGEPSDRRVEEGGGSEIGIRDQKLPVRHSEVWTQGRMGPSPSREERGAHERVFRERNRCICFVKRMKI